MGGDPRKAKIVIFRSGSEAATAAMGGHIDYAVSVVPSIIGPFSGGKLRVLGVAAPRRLGGALAQTPTLNEQGLKSVSSNWRMVVGPKGMTPGQTAFWDNTLGRMVQTADWKKELQNSLQEFVYRDSRASLQYCEDQDRVLGAALGDLGLLKER
jgi:putative tricarboxylic transport membrane protein